jgi:hypothetical protein
MRLFVSQQHVSFSAHLKSLMSVNKSMFAAVLRCMEGHRFIVKVSVGACVRRCAPHANQQTPQLHTNATMRVQLQDDYTPQQLAWWRWLLGVSPKLKLRFSASNIETGEELGCVQLLHAAITNHMDAHGHIAGATALSCVLHASALTVAPVVRLQWLCQLLPLEGVTDVELYVSAQP